MIELNVIRIRNAVFYAYHGALADEQNLGGKFEVDVDLYCDFAPATESDSLKKTVDYENVYLCIQRTVTARNYRLLEGLAVAIATAVLREFFNVERVIVRLRKPHPPVKGVVDHVEVEYTLSR